MESLGKFLQEICDEPLNPPLKSVDFLIETFLSLIQKHHYRIQRKFSDKLVLFLDIRDCIFDKKFIAYRKKNCSR